MKANICDEWFGHGVEKTIVDNDDERSDNVITLRKFGVSYIVFTNLIAFSNRISIFFVA